MITERGQANEPHIVWFHLFEISAIDKSIETEDGLVVFRSWEEKMDGGMIKGWGILMSGWMRCFGRMDRKQKIFWVH